MILSFHPMITADQNLLCAGRDPGEEECSAICKADAVILPQGCRKSLYDMATGHCADVFPNYSARFAYPGKTGQAALFSHLSLSHPETQMFASVAGFESNHQNVKSFPFPFVFKFDWGGEGDTVMRMDGPEDFQSALKKAKLFEKTGQFGFITQAYVPCGNRCLRVAVIGSQRISYWRVQRDPDRFGTALARGGAIEAKAEPEYEAAGIDLVNRLCEKTGINLAGVDVIFPENTEKPEPLLLEINYFFGRTGLGGSERFYRLLRKAVREWLRDRKQERHE